MGGQSPVPVSGKKLWEKSLTLHFALTHAPHRVMVMVVFGDTDGKLEELLIKVCGVFLFVFLFAYVLVFHCCICIDMCTWKIRCSTKGAHTWSWSFF